MKEDQEIRYNEKLRRKAEEKLRTDLQGKDDLSFLPPEAKDRLLHELRVHQLELEMQNEELRRIQQELERARDRYSDLYDFAPIGYFTIDGNGLIVEANLTGADLLGVARGVLIGSPFTQFIFSEDQDVFYLHRQKLLETLKRRSCELRLIRKGGGVFYAMMECVPIMDAKGNCYQVHAAVNDISQKKRLEQELLKTQKFETIGRMAAGIAHDFNNLLTSIMGNISLAEMLVESGSEAFDVLKEAETSCRRTSELVGHFLTFTIAGQPVKKAGSIARVIKDTADMALASANVKVEFSIPEDLWMVEFDAGQVQQALTNVLINAREAVPEGGVIRVCAENISIGTEETVPGIPLADGNCVKISVQDQGPGIPKENLPHLFDPYFSTKDRNSRKGMGLGLSMTYSIIKKHDGHIHIDSKAGAGTTVHIYLPAVIPGGAGSE